MLQTLSVDLYYWMACMESASGRRGKSIIPKLILGIDGVHWRELSSIAIQEESQKILHLVSFHLIIVYIFTHKHDKRMTCKKGSIQ